MNKKKNSFTFHFGLSKEKAYFIENFSMLVGCGMPMVEALDAVYSETRSRRMKSVMSSMKSEIEAGFPFWMSLKNCGLFPEHAISLVRLGEESGKFIDNLKIVAIEDEKRRMLKSKLTSAIMYPGFVLSLTLIIGVGIAWFLLPKLATVFLQLKIQLPLVTKILIGIGSFLGEHGFYVIPLVLVAVILLFYFIFLSPKTKYIGQFFLFYLPGINRLIKEVEIARFGYLLGTLFEAGLPITYALDSLAGATEISQYRKFYRHLKTSIEDGSSLQKSFMAYKRVHRLFPASIQQLIVAGEKSGMLSISLLKIGKIFETKTDTSAKNLSIIFEPLMLIIVWLGVVAVALAVILPIYNLIGGFSTNPQL